MRNRLGRFVKGTHWRSHQLFRDKEWLEETYITQGKSTGEIASMFNVTDAAILFWMRKHNIKRRNVSEARKNKTWGSHGSNNPMYGRTGDKNPRWRGGCTPERQAFYLTEEWKNCVKKVWERDNATCQKCGTRRDKQNKFHIHHIISFRHSDYRTTLDNLVLLCGSCHRFVHSKKNISNEYIQEI